MASVSIRGLTKSFDGKKQVLDDVSFTVNDGEFVSLLGSSGCGKSTLLRIIAGLEHSDSGDIMIGGRNVGNLSPKERDIAMVFQSYALYPHFNVEQNIGMGLKLRGMASDEIRRRVLEAAKRLEIDGLMNRRPAALSGGQRQRVALARTLVREPKAFLLDEPLSNLDALLREKTRGELKLLFKRVKGTVIYVTHDQTEAMTLSDRVVVLERGKIQQMGTPYDIYHKPANVFVASFLGSPPMNLFKIDRASQSGLRLSPLPAAVWAGIRPEDIETRRETFLESTPASLVLAESTGAVGILTLDVGGVVLKTSTGAILDCAATAFHIRIPPERLHYFDQDGYRIP